MILLKRVYDEAQETDGMRYYVERLWPRGIKKTDLKMDAWMKAVSPSGELRRWFGHEPAKWEEFQRRYRDELELSPEAWQPLLEAARAGDITLLYAARDTERNSAVLLKEFLEEKLGRG